MHGIILHGLRLIGHEVQRRNTPRQQYQYNTAKFQALILANITPRALPLLFDFDIARQTAHAL